MNEQLDTAVLLARFKLLVKRQLGESVDLDLLVRDADYGRVRLAALEEQAENEELLIMLLRVRQRLYPVAESVPLVPEPPPTEPEPPSSESGRSYKFGARSW